MFTGLLGIQKNPPFKAGVNIDKLVNCYGNACGSYDVKNNKSIALQRDVKFGTDVDKLKLTKVEDDIGYLTLNKSSIETLIDGANVEYNFDYVPFTFSKLKGLTFKLLFPCSNNKCPDANNKKLDYDDISNFLKVNNIATDEEAITQPTVEQDTTTPPTDVIDTTTQPVTDSRGGKPKNNHKPTKNQKTRKNRKQKTKKRKAKKSKRRTRK